MKTEKVSLTIRSMTFHGLFESNEVTKRFWPPRATFHGTDPQIGIMRFTDTDEVLSVETTIPKDGRDCYDVRVIARSK